MNFGVIERNLVRHCILIIGIQFLFFAALFWFLDQNSSLVAPYWLCAIGVTAISAYFEVFWRLIPNLRHHQRNKEAGGIDYKCKVEAAIEQFGLRNMLYTNWFARKLDDVLNERNF